jgi:hypothetical protein
MHLLRIKGRRLTRNALCTISKGAQLITNTVGARLPRKCIPSSTLAELAGFA